MKLKLLGAAALLTASLVTPVLAQEVVQEPGATGFNYPNSRYLTGGYGQRTPWNTDRTPRIYGGYAAVPSVGIAVGPGGVAVGPVGPGYDAYGYDPY